MHLKDTTGMEEVNSFSQFWKLYPRKVAKAYAERCFVRALKRGADPSEILEAARRYRELCELEGREKRFIMHASTFLNEDRWRDYLLGGEADELLEQARRTAQYKSWKAEAQDVWQRLEEAVRRRQPALLSEVEREAVEEAFGSLSWLREHLPDPQEYFEHRSFRSRFISAYLRAKRRVVSGQEP